MLAFLVTGRVEYGDEKSVMYSAFLGVGLIDISDFVLPKAVGAVGTNSGGGGLLASPITWPQIRHIFSRKLLSLFRLQIQTVTPLIAIITQNATAAAAIQIVSVRESELEAVLMVSVLEVAGAD